MYTDLDLQKTTKLALELFVKGQEHDQTNFAPWEKVFKAYNRNLYYESLYMEYHYFCQ